jgi:hypothetical protein
MRFQDFKGNFKCDPKTSRSCPETVSTNCVYMAPVLVLAMMLACQGAAEVAGFAAAPPAALDTFRRSACWVPPAARCERGGALRSARGAGAPDISVAHRRRRECPSS